VTAGAAALWALDQLGRQGQLHDLSPADVDQLLAAPIARPLIVRRALTGAAVAAVAQAVLLSPALLAARRPLVGALALGLFAALLQVSGRLTAAMSQWWPDRRWWQVAQQLGLLGVVAVAIGGGAAASGRAPALAIALDSTLARALLLPFSLMGTAFTAPSLAASAGAVAALAGLLAAITALTVRIATPIWLELAVAGADHRGVALRAMAQRGVGAAAGSDRLFGGRLRGTGAVALTQARLRSVLRMRLLRRTLGGAVLYGLFTGVVVDSQTGTGTLALGTAATAFLVATALGAIRGEVHGEIDRLVELRALPVSPLGLYLAHVIPGVLIVQATSAPVIALGVLLWAPRSGEILSAIIGVGLGAPLYLTLSASLYLLLPYRAVPGLRSPAAMLRQVLVPMVTILITVLVITAAGVVSLGLSLWVNASAGVAAWVVATSLGTLAATALGAWRIARVEPPAPDDG
jgi:type IV secretory pathway TrbD component